MPTFQTGIQKANSLLLGSVKAEVSATSSFSTTLTNIGLGRGFTITENITQSNIQADNGEEPLEFVTDHTATVNFEMLEFWIPNLDTIRGGIDTYSSSTDPLDHYTLAVGGKSKIAPRYWKFTNTILASDGSTSYERIVHVISASIGAGITMAFQSDRAEDPSMVIPITLTARLDTTRETTDGQLFYIEDFYGPSSG